MSPSSTQPPTIFPIYVEIAGVDRTDLVQYYGLEWETQTAAIGTCKFNVFKHPGSSYRPELLDPVEVWEPCRLIYDGAITAGSTTLHSTLAVFTSADVHVRIPGAGVDGRDLYTQIASVTSATAVEVRHAASTSVFDADCLIGRARFRGFIADLAQTRLITSTSFAFGVSCLDLSAALASIYPILSRPAESFYARLVALVADQLDEHGIALNWLSTDPAGYNVDAASYDGTESAKEILDELITMLQATSTLFTTPGTTAWMSPSDVDFATAQCWAAGGGGEADQSNFAFGDYFGGGGGGAYALGGVLIDPSTSYNVRVGAAGTGGSAAGGGAIATDGGDSWFVDATTVLAAGGKKGSKTTTGGTIGAGADTLGGVGGLASACIGDITWSGGAGANGSAANNKSGAGGGGAGSTASGTDGVTGSGTAGVGGVDGGGDGGTGQGTAGAASNGSSSGGGGAGGVNAVAGGDGAKGKVIVTTQPTERRNWWIDTLGLLHYEVNGAQVTPVTLDTSTLKIEANTQTVLASAGYANRVIYFYGDGLTDSVTVDNADEQTRLDGRIYTLKLTHSEISTAPTATYLARRELARVSNPDRYRLDSLELMPGVDGFEPGQFGTVTLSDWVVSGTHLVQAVRGAYIGMEGQPWQFSLTVTNDETRIDDDLDYYRQLTQATT